MARYLDSKYGKIKPYKGNPRKISDGSFTKLCASIDRDPEFMQARPIIIDENNAILGGNQRQFAILSLLESGWSLEGEETIRLYGWECVFDGKLPDDWVRRLLKPKGMSAEDWEIKKQRFVLIDNSPEGMAGEFDYEIMGENFSPDVMADAGIDFANLDTGIQADAFQSAEEKAETSEYGEKQEKLETYKEHREKARANLDEMTDVRFYFCAIFQNHEQVKAVLDATSLPNEGEMFVDGLELAKRLGVELTPVDYRFPEGKTDKSLVELAMENEQEQVGVGDESQPYAAAAGKGAGSPAADADD